MRLNTATNRLALALFLLGCLLGLTGLLMLPRHLPAVLGLEPAGTLAGLLPADPAPLPAAGSPLSSMDVLLPPYLPEVTNLSTAECAGLLVAGGEAENGKPFYRIELTQEGLNTLLQRLCPSGSASGARCAHLQVDLLQGGLLVSNEVRLGPWDYRLGLLLLEEEGGLAPSSILVDDGLYSIPAAGLAARLASGLQAEVKRLVQGMLVAGPLPGKASIAHVSFHAGRLEALAAVPGVVALVGDAGWRSIEQGVEVRQVTVRTGAGRDDVRIVRLDPSAVTFSIHYQPRSPLPISIWARELEPLIVFNAGYFTDQHETIYLVVSGGQAYGTPLGDFAGMLAIESDGSASVRWLAQAPYNPDDPPNAAVQSFPLLVRPGGTMAFPSDADDGARSRRTAVAQDCEGRILVAVAPGTVFSLHELAVFLAESDLGVDIALNLDGGGSTGIHMPAAGARFEVDSIVPVPSVVVVESH